MTFKGIFTGQAESFTVPIQGPGGSTIGARINLVGTAQRQPLIRLVDEVSHAIDLTEAWWPAEQLRLLEYGDAVGGNALRTYSHSLLFNRAADRLIAGDEIMILFLEPADAGLLRQIAHEFLK
jgi:hypothetical protein